MKKILGILSLLVAVCVFAALASDSFRSGYNVENLIRRTALFGVISIGVEWKRNQSHFHGWPHRNRKGYPGRELAGRIEVYGTRGPCR